MDTPNYAPPYGTREGECAEDGDPFLARAVDLLAMEQELAQCRRLLLDLTGADLQVRDKLDAWGVGRCTKTDRQREALRAALAYLRRR